MINKIVASIAEALAGVPDGATVLVGGFGGSGMPIELVEGLVEQGARDLTIVANNAGGGEHGLARLLNLGRVRRIVCSFPRDSDGHAAFDALYHAGKIELELTPQGNLAERIRAAGAGIGAFFTPTGYGTGLARNPDGSHKETRHINGREYVLEYPIYGDVALIKAERGDRWGNLTYHKAARDFGPIMATAARLTIASVYEIAALGELDPETIITPGIFVHRIVQIPRKSWESPLKAGAAVGHRKAAHQGGESA
jgi:3-oxoadipate CoA-transferase alpha subunit